MELRLAHGRDLRDTLRAERDRLPSAEIFQNPQMRRHAASSPPRVSPAVASPPRLEFSHNSLSAAERFERALAEPAARSAGSPSSRADGFLERLQAAEAHSPPYPTPESRSPPNFAQGSIHVYQKDSSLAPRGTNELKGWHREREVRAELW